MHRCTEYIQICIEYKHQVCVIYCADTAARRPRRITRRHHPLQHWHFEFNLIHKFTFTERRQMNKGGMLNRIVIGSEFLPAVYLNFEQAIVRQCLRPNWTLSIVFLSVLAPLFRLSVTDQTRSASQQRTFQSLPKWHSVAMLSVRLCHAQPLGNAMLIQVNKFSHTD